MVMFHMRRGSLFDDPDADTFCVTVNCNKNGVMGAGIAKECKERYPDIFARYQAQCRKGNWKPGMCSLMIADNGDRILLVSTKDEWWDPSKIEWIQSILMRLANRYEEFGISNLALTHLGCGNGKLDKSEVRGLMQKYLADTLLELYLY